MKGLDYKAIKKCYEAHRVLQKYQGTDPYKKSDRTFGLGNCGWTEAEGYRHQVVYSQQEITIYPSKAYREYEIAFVLSAYPDGVERKVYRSPFKEYVHFNDAAGVRRYYLVPDEGLRIQQDGSGYKAMNPTPDYRITVNRTKAKEARQPAEDLYNFVDVLWDMLPDPDYADCPWYILKDIPAIEDRESWHEYVRAAKYARVGALQKSTLMQKLRQHYTAEALAYNITPVPDTETDHTEHWHKLAELREAGLLEQYEGKPNKKRARNKTDEKGIRAAT